MIGKGDFFPHPSEPVLRAFQGFGPRPFGPSMTRMCLFEHKLMNLNKKRQKSIVRSSWWAFAAQPFYLSFLHRIFRALLGNILLPPPTHSILSFVFFLLFSLSLSVYLSLSIYILPLSLSFSFFFFSLSLSPSLCPPSRPTMFISFSILGE